MNKTQQKTSPIYDYKFLKTFSYEEPFNYVALPYIPKQQKINRMIIRGNNDQIKQLDARRQKNSALSQYKTNNSLTNLLFYQPNSSQAPSIIKRNLISNEQKETKAYKQEPYNEYFQRENVHNQSSSQEISFSNLNSSHKLYIKDSPLVLTSRIVSLESRQASSDESFTTRKNFFLKRKVPQLANEKRILQILGREAQKHNNFVQKSIITDNVDMAFPVNVIQKQRQQNTKQNNDKFFQLTKHLDSVEQNNFKNFKDQLDDHFLLQQNKGKKELKFYLQKNEKTLMKKNIQDKMDALNMVISVLQQPIHINNTIKQQCIIDLEPQSRQSQQQQADQKNQFQIFTKDNIFSTQEELNRVTQNCEKLASKPTMKNIRISLLKKLLKLKQLNITPKQFMENSVFSSKPFQKPLSYELIQAAKLNDIERVQELLSKNKYLVYDFDHAYLTALHWAAKRGFFYIAKLLLQNGADPDINDLVGRSSMYIAAQYKFVDILQLMLYYQANPFTLSSLAEDYCQHSREIKSLLQTSRKVKILLLMCTPSLRDYVWKKEQSRFYIEQSTT